MMFFLFIIFQSQLFREEMEKLQAKVVYICVSCNMYNVIYHIVTNYQYLMLALQHYCLIHLAYVYDLFQEKKLFEENIRLREKVKLLISSCYCRNFITLNWIACERQQICVSYNLSVLFLSPSNQSVFGSICD